jgi:hypothetical protein
LPHVVVGNQHNTPNLNAASFYVTGKARRLNLHEGALVDQLGAGFRTVRVWASGGTWVRMYTYTRCAADLCIPVGGLPGLKMMRATCAYTSTHQVTAGIGGGPMGSRRSPHWLATKGA